MQVTEQIDAIKTLKVDPVLYLLVPRLIAGTIMVPLITILAELIGILGGAVIADTTVGLHPNRFFNSVWNYTNIYDIKVSLIKSIY